MFLPFVDPFPVDLHVALQAFEEMEFVLAQKIAVKTVQATHDASTNQLDQHWDLLVTLAQAGMREELTVSLQGFAQEFARDLAIKEHLAVSTPDILRLRYSLNRSVTVGAILEAHHQKWSMDLCEHMNAFQARHAQHLQQALLDAYHDARASLNVATAVVAAGGPVKAPLTPPPPPKPASPVVKLLMVILIGFAIMGFGTAIFLGMLLHP